MSDTSEFIIENGILIKYVGKGGSVEIPDGVEKIGANAFDGAKKITGVRIPDGVTNIDYCAFKGCSGLGEVIIPCSVLNIENSAFEQCTKLTCVEIQNPNTIAHNCFAGCKVLSYIKASEKTLDGILSSCSKIMKIRLCYGYLVSKDCNRIYEDNAKRLKKHLVVQAMEGDCAVALEKLFGCYKKPIAINELDEYLVAATGKTEVTAFLLDYKRKNYSVRQIEKNASNNEEKELGFKEKTLAEWRKVFAVSSGKEISLTGYKKKDAFVYIPAKIEGKDVVTIGACAFEGHYEITDIFIPASVTNIEWFAFEGCTNMVIHAPTGSYAEAYAKENGIVFVEE